ncbi:Npgr2 [Thalictrum thalictroides]|uniref:Npgr2 n=1 Tax=Thalictrum thalictroides TaxID=46969 RepID=A0A7J6X1R3_THATH|nr:Npgr2 [Thalictrum thalictroides]
MCTGVIAFDHLRIRIGVTSQDKVLYDVGTLKYPCHPFKKIDKALFQFSNEAAQACKVILDTVESALPNGLPQNVGSKLQETINKAVDLLPELWKLAGLPQEAILSYRRSLLHHWNLDTETTARIQK